jgi:hypothetical protein
MSEVKEMEVNYEIAARKVRAYMELHDGIIPVITMKDYPDREEYGLVGLPGINFDFRVAGALQKEFHMMILDMPTTDN